MTTYSETYNAFEALVDALVDPEARPHQHGRLTYLHPAQAEGVPPHGYPKPARRGPPRGRASRPDRPKGGGRRDGPRPKHG